MCIRIGDKHITKDAGIRLGAAPLVSDEFPWQALNSYRSEKEPEHLRV